jgi:hypothetical protein
VYRRANTFEKTFQYGHLVLGCRSALLPPPSWFLQRRARICSVTAPLLPPGPLADVLASWGPQRYTFKLKVLDSGFACAHVALVVCVFILRSPDLSVLEGIDFQRLDCCLVNSRTNQQIANCKAYVCGGDCRLDSFDAYDDLASIAERLVRVAMPEKDCPGQCVARALFFCVCAVAE